MGIIGINWVSQIFFLEIQIEDTGGGSLDGRRSESREREQKALELLFFNFCSRKVDVIVLEGFDF